ncbi:MAG: hypothetical protein R3C69_12305 [Geminicoccaceae bacterium]
MAANDDPILYGTTQPPTPMQRFAAGPLSIELEGAAVRYVRYAGLEAIRGIDYLVRDASWRTPPATLTTRRREQGENGFTVELEGVVRQDEIDYQYRQTITGSADGRLEVMVEAEAKSGFLTNRTGFVVLHPILGVAGKPVIVTHKDGSTSETSFPELISPGQPIFDIRALRHEMAPGLFVTCRMEAALPQDPETIFEMEDQRNWTDASYKTYVGSLLDPWPYRIEPGERLRQRIIVTFEGSAPARSAGAADGVALRLGAAAAGRVPAIGLGLMPEHRAAASADSNPATRLRPAFITAYAEAGSDDLARCLGDYAALARRLGAAVQLELVLPAGRPAAELLQHAAGQCAAARLAPARLLPCPSPYLKASSRSVPGRTSPISAISTTPPARPSPRASSSAACAATSPLNRKRPPAATIDGISCTTTPIVHAADDRSVMETLEALPAGAREHGGDGAGKPLHIGPSAIAMRHNPYGTATAPNPAAQRIAMVDDDPRQRSLFAAAWSVGYAAAMAEGGVATLALNHLAGPSGLAGASGETWPVFHVMAALCAASGAERVPCAITGEGVAALAWLEGGQTRLLVANLRPEPTALGFDRPVTGHLLDATAAAGPARTADWPPAGAPGWRGTELTLPALAVLFAGT